MRLLHTAIVGFVAASMVTVVNRFEPSRPLALALMIIIYLTAMLDIIMKLG